VTGGTHHRRLSVREELDLVVAAEAGDPVACRGLVEAFLPAIAGLARGFDRGGAVERTELIQEGVAGLLHATRRYDPRLETPFWAYASFWVRKAMQDLTSELVRPVALSDRAVRGLARIRAARREHLQTHAVEPTSAELSRATGFTPDQLESLLATERTPRGIDESLHGEEAATATVGEAIADPAAEREYEEVLDRIELREVRRLADELDERERTVVSAHYGLGQSAQTLNQIGAALGLTAERARQIEGGALTKLREALAEPVLQPLESGRSGLT
jgi:RNA polymerase sigma factor (sigma-70 family)